MFFVNTLVIVIVQLPISRADRRSAAHARARADARTVDRVVAARRLQAATGSTRRQRSSVFTVALGIFGIGECFHGPAHQALVAEDRAGAPARPLLRGPVRSRGGSPARSGPAAGGFLLAVAPFALWPVAAFVCLAAALGALALEARSSSERFRRMTRGSSPSCRCSTADGSSLSGENTARMANVPLIPVYRGSTQYRCRACLASGAHARATPSSQ